MVVARASGMDLASTLKRNTFLTLGSAPGRVRVRGPRGTGGQRGPRDGGTRGARDGGTRGPKTAVHHGCVLAAWWPSAVVCEPYISLSPKGNLSGLPGLAQGERVHNPGLAARKKVARRTSVFVLECSRGPPCPPVPGVTRGAQGVLRGCPEVPMRRPRGVRRADTPGHPWMR